MSQAQRFYAAVALAVIVVVAILVIRRPREEQRPAPAPPAADAIVPWCAEGLEPIRGGGCYAAPASARSPVPLLVYLHGRHAPDAVDKMHETQARVARIANAHGYAVLALQGRQGECTDPSLATWWCWPSNEKNAQDGPRFVMQWATAIAEAERRGGRGRRVLLGFSNGGYFAALVASRSLLPIDAVAIAHAGPVPPMTPVGTPPPALLINADEDPSDAEMQRLAGDLTRERWPFVFVERGGGHALPDWDVETAMTFFERTAKERLPLVPPVAPVHVRDASTPPPTDADAAPEPAPERSADPAPEPADPAPPPEGASPPE